MPESAERAIARTRKAGNLVFINTGRTMGSMKAVLPSLEADGYLCGCGTQLWLNGKVIYQKSVPHERGLAIKRLLGTLTLTGFWRERITAISERGIPGSRLYGT